MVLELLEFMRARREEILADIEELARIESPTADRAAVNRAADLVEGWAAELGLVERFPEEDYGDHLRITFDFGEVSEQQCVLCLGHLDTVYPVGTLTNMPVRRADGRLWGPGVFDMKGAVVYYLWCARALRSLGIRPRRPIVVQLNADEEVGSPVSRPLTEEIARRASVVLVGEPSFGREGRVKTARKGGGRFVVRVQGVSSHAGLDFASGASATLELARQVDRIAGWTDLEAGVTINPGLMRGGTATNVVAGEAEAEFDVRVPTAELAASITARFESLTPFDPRTKVAVEGGLRRPPMERGPVTVSPYERARVLSAEMGVELGEASVGGGSDGNFTAAMGVPTLDGLGAVGEGAHAVTESIWLDRVADRAALIAALMATG